MKIVLKSAVALAVLAFATAPPAAAGRAGGGGVPPCQQAVTNVPWGTTDTDCVGAPGMGGTGGPNMRISEQGHRNWPNFKAKVSGHGSVANGPRDR